MTKVWSKEWLTGSIFEVLQPLLAQIDWTDGAWPSLAAYQAFLDTLANPPITASGARLRVVPQARSAEHWQSGYEPRIYLAGELQTRSENWHDLFNLLVWAAFPCTKAALNRRHFAIQQAQAENYAGKPARNSVQDVLTHFDETGVIIACANPELEQLMRDFRWKELFWQRRGELATGMACYLFGHGLMDKALEPYSGMTGKGIVVPVEKLFFSLPMSERLAYLDGVVAERIAQLKRPGDLAPVPVLGFPGFIVSNQKESYYDDKDYFRPGRRGPVCSS